MFFSKNKNQKAKADKSKKLHVHSIPEDFYGGLDPIVKFKTVEKEVERQRDPSQMLSREERLHAKASSAGGDSKMHPANLFSNKKFLIITGSVLFLVFVAGATFYYLNQAKNQAEPINVAVQKPTPKTPEPVEPEVVIPKPIQTPPVVEPEPVEILPENNFIEFPSILLGNGSDLDNDGLFDDEETLFNTDPGIPDTDGDGYLDGHEVFFLYNPKGTAPMNLIDSGLVKQYTSASFGFTLFYPEIWTYGAVQSDNRIILFTSPNGEYVEVNTVDLKGSSFTSWFSINAKNQSYGDLQPFDSRFKEQGFARSDKLVYYFINKNRLHILVYHDNGTQIAKYKNIVNMMARSFKLFGNQEILSDQINSEDNLTNIPEEVLESTASSTIPDTENGEVIL